MSDLSLEDQNYPNKQTEVIGVLQNGHDFQEDVILQVRPAMTQDAPNGYFPPLHRLVAIQAIGNCTVPGNGVGVEGIGGVSGSGDAGIGVRGIGVNGGVGVVGQGSDQGAGVVGIASDPNPAEPGKLPSGVLGVSAGVFGMSLGSGSNDIGIRGENVWDDNAPGHQAGQGQGVGVLGVVHVKNGVGVRGENDASTRPGIAVNGDSSFGIGVQGVSHGDAGVGVRGLAKDGDTGIGVLGEANGARGLGVIGESIHGVAGVFAAGPAGVQFGDAPPGRAGVFGSDSAAQVRLVPHIALNPPTSNQHYDASFNLEGTRDGIPCEWPDR